MVEYKVIVYHNRTDWYNLDGELHREDGLFHREWNDGDKYWFRNGLFHREDGPAMEYADGTKQWWVDGKRHREDGPAVEYADGDNQWWINNVKLTEKEFLKKTQPKREVTMAELEKELGYSIKIVK